jgi:hypothetical protein
MNKTKVIGWLFLIHLIIIYSSVISKRCTVASNQEQLPFNNSELEHILDATIYIAMFPTDYQSVENGKVYYEIGLGTLVNSSGEVILYTHDHWGMLDNLGRVQFLDNQGNILLDITGDTFKELIRYRDEGTMVLARSSKHKSDYLAALIHLSRSKSQRKLSPAHLGDIQDIHAGDLVIIARTDRENPVGVDLMAATVESIDERWGAPVLKLRNHNCESIAPGDSGGGIWLNGELVGNMWKAKYTYNLKFWTWDSQKPEGEWLDTSFAAMLPVEFDEAVESQDSPVLVNKIGPQSGTQDY